MLLTQKYNSLNEIEAEFKDSINQLLAQDLIDLKQLESYEKNSPENHTFYYYLFFGQTNNLPVGIAWFELIRIEDAAFIPFMQKLKQKLSKKAVNKWLSFKGIGKTKSFFHFESKQYNLGLMELKSIINEFSNREDIAVEEIWFNAQTRSLFPFRQAKFKREIRFMAPLKKNWSSYENYFFGLDNETSHTAKIGWKMMAKGPYKLREDLSIHDVAKEFKPDRFNGLETMATVLSRGDEDYAAIFMSLGRHHTLHVDIEVLKDTDDFPLETLYHYVIMKWFEHPHTQYLSANYLAQIPDQVYKNLRMKVEVMDQIIIPLADFAKEKLKDEDLFRYS